MVYNCIERFSSLKADLFRQIDASSLAIFRIGFGVIMFWDIWRYYRNDWIGEYYLEPEFLFKYYGFEWVQPWPGDGMYIHFFVMGVLAFMIAIGALYRLSIILFTLAFTYVFLLDQAHYLNHFYMVILFSLLLCIAPANRHLSVDAWLRPALRSPTVPAWSLWILRVQMEIILIFAGIVKLNPDWLRLQPLSMWLESRSDFPVLGYFFLQDWSVAIAAWGVILLHLVGAPLLLYKKTRLTVFCIYAAFHTLNHFVFSIGIFPWFTLFASLLFFDPDWPVRLKHKILSTVSRPEQQPPNSSTPDTIVSGEQHQYHSQPFFHHSRFQQKLVLSFLFFWTTSQILIPLRHLLYPGNVSWTEEGHRFSWQMKLRDKLGKTTFKVHDPVKKKTWLVNPSERLSRRQYRKMTTRPDMILQYAHFVAQHFKTQKGSTLNNTEQVEVRATVYVSLNGRKPALLIDPERDLARINRNLWHADWILPLTEPFRRFDKSG